MISRHTNVAAGPVIDFLDWLCERREMSAAALVLEIIKEDEGFRSWYAVNGKRKSKRSS
jgi:hypothetical protein